MRRFMLPAAMALAFAGSAAFAQQATPMPDTQATPAPVTREHHEPNPQHEAKHLARQLNLTPDQTAKIEPILADRDQKVSAVMANTALAPDDRTAQVKSIHKATMEQMDAILTPDQREQLKAERKNHHAAPASEATPPPAA